MRILSIDPGYERLGIAIIERTPPSQKETLVYSNCFKTSASLSFSKRLLEIGQELERVITNYSPDVLSVENIYFYSNQKTAMNVSHVRGVIIYLAEKYGLEIFEYTPMQIKVAVTGYGKSDKNQVIAMIPKLITVTKSIQYDDEYDAIAIGLTCFASERFM